MKAFPDVFAIGCFLIYNQGIFKPIQKSLQGF